MKKNAIRLVCIFLIFVLCLGIGNQVFRFKYYDGIFNIRKFYEQDKDSVDLLILGSSHAYEDINTGQLWQDYGISSYILSGSVQRTWNTYYYLKEALKTQHPKLIVYEAYGAILPSDYGDDSNVIKNTFGMKWSKNRIDAIKTSVPENRYPEFLLGYIQYHARFAELSAEDFYPNLHRKYYEDWKGYAFNTNTEAFESPEISRDGDTTPLSEKTEEYLRKTMELAKDADIPMVVIVSPYAGITEEQHTLYRSVESLTKEYGFAYRNFNLMYEELGLDFETEMADWGHLNYLGSQKYTAALADWLSSDYDFPDHRTDEHYASWERNASFINESFRDQEIKNAETPADAAKLLSCPDYLCFVNAKAADPSDPQIQALYHALGISSSFTEGGCIADSSGVLQFSADTSEAPLYLDTEYHTFALKDRMILADHQEQDTFGHNLSVTVFDKATEEIVCTIEVP